MKTMLKLTLFGIFGLVLIGFIAFYVDYYYYSWTSYIQPFGCRYKEISGKNTNLLEQNYDLVKIGEETKSDSKYKSVSYRASKLEVVRVFRDVEYGLRINYYTTSTGNYYELSVSNRYTNELKTTPDYYIRQNIDQMINEMPLLDEQKEDLKSKIQVSCQSEMRIGI